MEHSNNLKHAIFCYQYFLNNNNNHAAVYVKLYDNKKGLFCTLKDSEQSRHFD